MFAYVTFELLLQEKKNDLTQVNIAQTPYLVPNLLTCAKTKFTCQNVLPSHVLLKKHVIGTLSVLTFNKDEPLFNYPFRLTEICILFDYKFCMGCYSNTIASNFVLVFDIFLSKTNILYCQNWWSWLFLLKPVHLAKYKYNLFRCRANISKVLFKTIKWPQINGVKK